jgi:hypothetical protein
MYNTYPEHPEPLFGQLWPSTNSFVPHDRKVGDTAKVLGHSNSCVKVEHYMPPAARNKDCLSWFLKNFQLKSGMLKFGSHL